MKMTSCNALPVSYFSSSSHYVLRLLRNRREIKSGTLVQRQRRQCATNSCQGCCGGDGAAATSKDCVVHFWCQFCRRSAAKNVSHSNASTPAMERLVLLRSIIISRIRERYARRARSRCAPAASALLSSSQVTRVMPAPLWLIGSLSSAGDGEKPFFSR